MLAFNQSWQVCWSIWDNPDLSQWKPKPFTRAQITGPDCGNQRRVSFSVSSSASSLCHEPALFKFEFKYLYSMKKVWYSARCRLHSCFINQLQSSSAFKLSLYSCLQVSDAAYWYSYWNSVVSECERDMIFQFHVWLGVHFKLYFVFDITSIQLSLYPMINFANVCACIQVSIPCQCNVPFTFPTLSPCVCLWVVHSSEQIWNVNIANPFMRTYMVSRWFAVRRKQRKNCELCPTQITWKVKSKCQICLYCLSRVSWLSCLSWSPWWSWR